MECCRPYALADELEIKLGARYNHDESRFTSGYFAPAGNAGPRLLDLTSPMVEGDTFTGRALVNWTPSDDILVYGSVSRGYKPGGFSAVFFGFGGPYEAEYVTNYEVGSKGSLAGDALNYALSAFCMDYMGYQASLQIDPVNPLSTVVVNVDGSTSKGVEAQLFGQIGGFRWDTSLSVLDTSFGSQMVNIPPNATGFGSPPGTTNLAGRDLNYAPRFSASAGVAYEVMLGNYTLTPSVRVSHQSGQWANFLQLPYNRIPERTLVDARLAFAAEAGWQVEGYVTNLLEEEYYSAVGIIPDGIGSFMAGAPREFGVRARFGF